MEGGFNLHLVSDSLVLTLSLSLSLSLPLSLLITPL